ncbi:DUF6680 family protein [Qipengyuania spongiae]|uniref:DUF6680 domain-containing protein n=1 Tax=Qipengyuania spongiae TaxID=2909673 RepID=A0ABY5SY50_9SPHN|nr:DUF6680 family protein [Qipengyuania spongiae]UVI39250.1 hypothetical protein L1F33_13620 [Qipengyuania spongiae]
MELNDWLTLLAIVLGPIIAVVITLAFQKHREDRERKLVVVRMLMATRHLPGDPNYSTAINLIPVEFHGKPAVMEAFKEYKRATGQDRPLLPDGNHRVNQEVATAQTKLISALLQTLGMSVSEADLAVQAYAADGMVQRDLLFLRSLDAQIRTADALEKSLKEE